MYWNSILSLFHPHPLSAHPCVLIRGCIPEIRVQLQLCQSWSNLISVLTRAFAGCFSTDRQPSSQICLGADPRPVLSLVLHPSRCSGNAPPSCPALAKSSAATVLAVTLLHFIRCCPAHYFPSKTIFLSALDLSILLLLANSGARTCTSLSIPSSH